MFKPEKSCKSQSFKPFFSAKLDQSGTLLILLDVFWFRLLQNGQQKAFDEFANLFREHFAACYTLIAQFTQGNEKKKMSQVLKMSINGNSFAAMISDWSR